MAGLVWEIPSGIVFKSPGGETVSEVYFSTNFGNFAWTGSPIAQTRYNKNLEAEEVIVPVPTEANLKDIYDAQPELAQFISKPDDYMADWES